MILLKIKLDTANLFFVKVPVLSVHITEVDPKDSTVSRFLTNTFFSDICLAAKASIIVTVANKPSGTLATIIPIGFIKLNIIGSFFTKLNIRNIIPNKIAIDEIILIK